ncbi:MAG: hypothetical protein GC149_03205 [Gammaproteobacteria bacterium]|nr:hypothetical protein [Gammaproteobacteria bacterium]
MSDEVRQAADAGAQCVLRTEVDMSGITVLALTPESRLPDYRAALALANQQAGQQLGDYMLLSWYDRDRDFESPQHASECHLDSAIPGYVDYGVSHGATLKVDIEQGRFVFFYLPVS